jgi:hypothetical protein
MSGYDIIGDVHGCADKLEGLLQGLGYEEFDGAYRYAGTGEEHKAVFVGDLIDRGSQQIKSLELVRAMVEAGSAQIVMGNHEFNAISFATPNLEIPGEFMRTHSDKNRKQHQAFTNQVQAKPGLYAEAIEWFRTLPLWLDLDGIRVIHACWNDKEIDKVEQWLPPGTPMSTEFVVKANQKGSPEHRAIEVLLKGPELSLTKYGRPDFVDKDGHVRHHARIRWWNSEGKTLDDLAEIPRDSVTAAGDPYPKLPKRKCSKGAAYEYTGEKPVFYGHYWRTGEPVEGEDWTHNTVCVDFSAVNGEPLVAYRWHEEEKISFEHYVAHAGNHRAESKGH